MNCSEGRTARTQAPGHAEPGELASWKAEAWAFPYATCAATAISADGAGNTTRAASGGFVTSVAVPSEGDSAVAVVTGEQVGVIAHRGPSGGRATVLLDGQPLALLDLYANADSGPEVVFVADLPAGEHTITVEPTGSSDPGTAGTSVSVDGFVTLVHEG